MPGFLSVHMSKRSSWECERFGGPGVLGAEEIGVWLLRLRGCRARPPPPREGAQDEGRF